MQKDDMSKLLEELEGTPHIEKPDELDVSSGSVCWMNPHRICGADCTAFHAEELDEHGQPDDGPNKCLFLLYAGQVGSAALTFIRAAQTLVQLTKPAVATPPDIKAPDAFGDKR